MLWFWALEATLRWMKLIRRSDGLLLHLMSFTRDDLKCSNPVMKTGYTFVTEVFHPKRKFYEKQWSKKERYLKSTRIVFMKGVSYTSPEPLQTSLWLHFTTVRIGLSFLL